ncbi:hypothetical protein SASPL_149193 [Salvia splendens]|uniref:Uncharacterized protein n=1 Tax=Salvia splendens TaxID=180675 RepID=A0A8X8Z503_SALSN|nr:hypothetical protein SASPL_149193 [Salvia splendens]
MGISHYPLPILPPLLLIQKLVAMNRRNDEEEAQVNPFSESKKKENEVATWESDLKKKERVVDSESGFLRKVFAAEDGDHK